MRPANLASHQVDQAINEAFQFINGVPNSTNTLQDLLNVLTPFLKAYPAAYPQVKYAFERTRVEYNEEVVTGYIAQASSEANLLILQLIASKYHVHDMRLKFHRFDIPIDNLDPETHAIYIQLKASTILADNFFSTPEEIKWALQIINPSLTSILYVIECLNYNNARELTHATIMRMLDTLTQEELDTLAYKLIISDFWLYSQKIHHSWVFEQILSRFTKVPRKYLDRLATSANYNSQISNWAKSILKD